MYKSVIHFTPKPNNKAVFNWTVLWFSVLLGIGYLLPPAFALSTAESTLTIAKLPGYLAEAELPDSVALLPPPPINTDPTAQAADEAAYQSGMQLRGTARWELAIQDINISKYPEALTAFACAIGFVPSEVDTPNLVTLIRRTRTDASAAAKKAKNTYMRARPFFTHKTSTCDPADEKILSTNGSYPSGHASVGWAWALILAELIPSQKDALFAKGYSFGQSRVVCGYHWQTDVNAGRLVGAATVAVLHTKPEFKAQLEAARAEIEKKLSTLQTPLPKCLAETLLK